MTRSVDLLPTIIELNGWELDRSSACLEIDGKSLIPFITGEQKNDRMCFFSTAYLDQMQEGVINKVVRKFACRDKNWKLIYDRENDTYQLYDLNNDPGEKQNLANEKKEIMERYKSLLQEQIDDVTSQLSETEAKFLSDQLRDLGYI